MSQDHKTMNEILSGRICVSDYKTFKAFIKKLIKNKWCTNSLGGWGNRDKQFCIIIKDFDVILKDNRTVAFKKEDLVTYAFLQDLYHLSVIGDTI